MEHQQTSTQIINASASEALSAAQPVLGYLPGSLLLMSTKPIPRPGDWIRMTNDRWAPKGSLFVVTEGRYANGVVLATHSFAWVELDDCEFVRRATDEEFIAALERAGQ